ncbi:MAG: WD40/YVTN/BNR-like repeat-containing protein [Vicinamibacterales bacterium]
MLRPFLLLIVLLIVTAPLRSDAQSTVTVDPKLYRDLKWRSVGPHRGGRVTAIAGVRSKPCTFYMGATGGGVWKTESCGNLWTPVSDGQIATGSIGAIDVSESNPDVVYVGTGSAAIRSNVIIGRGMYKSTDGGRSWQLIGLRDAGQIGAVVVHPTNPDTVWIAALGSPFGPNDERGIFKTTDGGRTWKKILFVNNETGGRVVAINWSNPNEVYAGMYRGFRKGWDIISGGPANEGGIYKSSDGGETWTKLSAGLPQKLIGKIDLDVSRSNPRVVYAMVEGPGAEGGLYRSDDAGATWRNVNNSARLRARPFYFHYVDINPRSENEVWVNELALHKSSDGGKTFTQVAVPHGDNHGIWFNPDNPNVAIQCNDGGASVTQDGGRTWSSILNQPTAELYMVSVDEQFPYRLYAPQQDNSTVIVPSLPPHSWGYDNQAQSWTQGPGCETGQIHPRPDGSVIWGACKGEVGRYSVATGQEKHTWIYPQNRYGHDPDDIKYRFPRQTVIVVSPHDPKTVYQASHVVHRTTDEGVTWTTISPDLTAREPDKQIVPGSPITRDITGEEVYSSIYSMVESRLERGVLWVGANDGPVHVSRDGGKSWTNVTPKDLPPGGRVQNIEDSPHRKGSAYIAVYRFLREHDLKPHIYVTNDYGKSWSKLTDGTNGIPIDHPARVVREDPDRQGLLYAGTEFGFFVSFDNGRRWQALQQNLPATPVTDIRVHRKDLVIATMGRSFWIMDNVTPLHQLAGGSATTTDNGNPSNPANHRLFTPAVAWRTRHAASGGSPDVPEYPGPGARIDYVFAGVPSGSVKLEILDAKGTVIRAIEPLSATPQPGAPGMRAFRRGGVAAALGIRDGHNRYLWDLRHSGADGPMVAPGKYQVRLTAGSWSETKPLELKIDPRLAADGVTQADLEEQTAFLLKVRDAIAEARTLSASLRERKDLYGKLVTAEGPYPQPMLIDQLSSIARMVGQADQRIGKEAQTRFDDLMKELAQIRAVK